MRISDWSSDVCSSDLIATLVDQSEKALLFHNVTGYKTPVVSGIFRNQRRTALGMGCSRFSDVEEKLRRALEQPVPAVPVSSASSGERRGGQRRVRTGRERWWTRH